MSHHKLSKRGQGNIALSPLRQAKQSFHKVEQLLDNTTLSDEDKEKVLASKAEEWEAKDSQWHYTGILDKYEGCSFEFNEDEHYWLKNGVYHREDDKPAVVNADGSKEWYWAGNRHRENGEAAVISFYGEEQYWEHGIRLDEPHFFE